jgi:tRNA (cmo5U34)-methyltransferase
VAGETWTEAESVTYRIISDVAVPERERQIAIMTDLVSATTAPGPVLDLCCGEGLWTQALIQALPGATVYAYDRSPSMLAETRRRTGAGDQLVTREIDIVARDWRHFDQPLRAAVSSLAVHHLDGLEKQVLFADLYQELALGGVFVLADVIRPVTRVGDQLAARMWDEETERRARDRGSVDGLAAFQDRGWNHFHCADPDPVDKPSTIAEQIDWLRAAGFGNVDLHWMLAGQVVMSAWK